MKLGFFTMPMHPEERSCTDTLAEDREAIILADKLGFYDAFVGEHRRHRRGHGGSPIHGRRTTACDLYLHFSGPIQNLPTRHF